MFFECYNRFFGRNIALNLFEVIIMKAKLFFNNLKTIFLLVILFTLAAANAQNIAVWDFEAFPSGFSNPAPSFGVGTASLINQSGTASGGGTQGGNGNLSGCGSNQNGAGWQIFPFDPGAFDISNGVEFKTSTVGFENIFFKWDQRWSNTAANTERLQYTLDGVIWNNYMMTNSNTTYCNGALNATGSYEAASPGDSFRRFTADFSAVAGVANNPNFGVRLLATLFQITTEFRATTTNTDIAGTMGAWRFDNVSFTGSLFAGATSAVITANNSSICAGDPVNLSVVVTGGNGPFNLIYSNDGGTTQFTVPNYVSGTAISLTPTATKNYTIVSVQNALAVIGTSNFATGISGAPQVVVRVKPTFTATDHSSCAGAINLKTAGLSSFSPAGGVITFNPTFPFPTLYSGGNITYDVIYTVNGCSTTANISFTRKTAPVTTAIPTVTSTVCQGDSFSIITPTYTQTPTSYQWYRNTIPATTGGTPTIITGATAANYTPLSSALGTFYYYVRAYNVCGNAYSSVSGAYTVVAPPTIGVVSSAQSICSGSITNDLTIAGNSGTILKWQRADDTAFTTNVVDIANATATLTGAAIGNLTQTTYFRAVVTNGICSRNTSPIQILIKTTQYNSPGVWSNGLPDSTTSAIFNFNFTSTADINACKVIIINGVNVNFNSNNSLIVQNTVDASGGTLTFQDNASLVQPNNVTNLAGITTGGNAGNITYKRNSTLMSVYDFTFWSSPVANQNLYNFSPLTLFDKYFYWNSNPSIYYWSEILNGATTMVPATGYIVRSPLVIGSAAAIYNGYFIGVPNNGTITTPITVSGTLNVNNRNLIGNPYPSAIDGSAFLTTNNSVLNGSMYFWTHNTPVTNLLYNNNDYATFNLTGGLSAAALNSGINNIVPDGKIAAGQAFFVEGITNGNAVFNNSMRLIGNNNFFYRNNNAGEKHRIWLELSYAGGAFSQTLLGYVTGATNDKDNGYDSKLFSESPTASFYSLIANEKMAIKGNALPFQDSEINQLGYISKIDADFDITLAKTDGLFDNQNIYLQDNLLNVVHDLKQNPYHFSTLIGTFNDRFLLRFTNVSLSGNQNIILDNAVQVFNKNDDVLIKSLATDLSSISIFDISGRLLFETNDLDTKNYTIDNLKTSNQILLVQIKLKNGLTINKKIIH